MHLPLERLLASDLTDDEGAHLRACRECDELRRSYSVAGGASGAPRTGPAGPTWTSALAQPTVPGWNLLGQLGVGGMATVYRARNQLGVERALKVLHSTDPSRRTRLLREGRVLASLCHPNVVQVHDWLETDDGRPVLVLELVDGPDLGRRLHQGALGLAMIDEVARGILAGMAYAHQQGLVHRDLKPSNVLLDGTLAKVTDFGLVKVLGDPSDSAHPHAVGTRAYMAPEQQARPAEVDHRADIHAIGRILFEMVTGRRFVLDQPEKIHLPGVPERITAAIRSALEADPARRPPSCEALAAIWDGRAPATRDGAGWLAVELVGALPGLKARHDVELAALVAKLDAGDLGEDGVLALRSADVLVPLLHRYRALVAHLGRLDFRAGVQLGGEEPAQVGALLALARPGQILLCGLAAAETTSHGWYRLAGVPEPVEVSELPAGRAPAAPPDGPHGWRVTLDQGGVRPVAPVPHSLPPATRLVGRRAQLVALEQMLATGTVQLVGPCGVGKTALAVELGWGTLGGWSEVRYVDLTGVRTERDLAVAVACGLDLRVDHDDHLPDTVCRALIWRPGALLVLDGADDLDPPALDALGHWLASAPELRAIVTARASAWRWPLLEVAPLGLPAVGSAQDALEAPAAELLAEHLAARHPGWLPTEADAAAIGALARAGAGVPLALIAAVRAGEGRLGTWISRLPPERAPARVAEAMVGFAWERLEPALRGVLAQCTVFAGPFAPDAAARVLELEPGRLDALREQGWLAHTVGDRLALPGPAQALASEAQARSPGRAAAETRHGLYFCQAELTRADLPDLYLACLRAAAAGNGFVVAVGCTRFAALGGDGGPIAALAQQALLLPRLPDTQRADLLVVTSRGRALRDTLDRLADQEVHGPNRELRAARVLARDALEVLDAAGTCHQRGGNTLRAAEILALAGELALHLGRADEAHKLFSRALQASGRASLALKLKLEGSRWSHDPARPEALATLRSVADEARRAGQDQVVGDAHLALAVALRKVRRWPEARRALHGVLEARRTVGDGVGAGRALLELARVDRGDKRADAALHDLTAAITAFRQAGDVAWAERAARELPPASAPTERPAATAITAVPADAVDASDALNAARRYRDLGWFDQALNVLRKALATHPHPALAATLHAQAAALHQLRGDTEQVHLSLRAACAGWDQLPSGGDEDRAWWAAVKRRVQTRRTERTALSTRLAARGADRDPELQRRLAAMEAEDGHDDRAIGRMEAALRLGREQGRPALLAADHLQLARLELARGRSEDALHHAECAEEHAQTVGDRPGQALALLESARIRTYRAEHDLAAKRLLRAWRLGDQEPSLQAEIFAELACARARGGDRQLAWSCAARARKLLGADDPRRAWVLVKLAEVDPATASADLAEALELLVRDPDPLVVGWWLVAKARQAHRAGDAELTAAIAAETGRLCPNPGAPLRADLVRLQIADADAPRSGVDRTTRPDRG